MAELPKITYNGTRITTLKFNNTEMFNANLNGTRVYHKHQGSAVSRGGCYTQPVYHVHTGTAGQAAANGCYTTRKTGTRNATCSPYKTNSTEASYKNCPNCGAYAGHHKVKDFIRHPSCGQGDTNISYHTHCYSCGADFDKSGSTPNASAHTYQQSYTYYDLGCGKSTSTVISYSLGCGYSAT